MSEEVNGVLHCTAFGDLRPAEIRPECEECEHNAAFADNGGYPAMLLTGSRENLAAALRAPGVAMNDVVVVNAKRFQKMEDVLKKLLNFNPQNIMNAEANAIPAAKLSIWQKKHWRFPMKTETKYRYAYAIWLVIGLPVCVLFSPLLAVCMFLTIKGDIQAAMCGVNGSYRTYRAYVKKGWER